MNPVHVEIKIPHRWRVILVGHIDDVELALKALEENLLEAWIGFSQGGDDDEALITITLKWLDHGMLQMVRDIIESNYNDVHIVYNGGVDERGNKIKT